MIYSPLGPRGQFRAEVSGISSGFVDDALRSLPLLVEFAAIEGPTRFHTRSDGTQWIDSCKKMGGKKAK